MAVQRPVKEGRQSGVPQEADGEVAVVRARQAVPETAHGEQKAEPDERVRALPTGVAGEEVAVRERADERSFDHVAV